MSWRMSIVGRAWSFEALEWFKCMAPRKMGLLQRSSGDVKYALPWHFSRIAEPKTDCFAYERVQNCNYALHVPATCDHDRLPTYIREQWTADS